MTTVKNRDHIDYALSDTDLFTPAFVQSDIESSTFEEIYPITKLDDGGSVEFTIKNSSDKFIDFVNTYLRLKVRLLKADGTQLAETDTANFINYPIASIFNQLDVYLGETLITSSNNTYAFRSIIETVLNYGSEAKKNSTRDGIIFKRYRGT